MSDRSTPQQWYLSQAGEWTRDPEGALARIESSLTLRELAEPYNRFYRRAGGRWELLEEESELSPAERGLVWRGHKTSIDGRSYLLFDGIRVVDDFIAEQMLHRLTVIDEEGRVLDEPRAAGHRFLLSAADAKRFYAAVKRVGGVIERSEPLPQDARLACAAAESAAAEIQELTARDAAVLQAAAKGDFSGVGEFEQRAGPFRAALRRAEEARKRCAQAVAALQAPGRSLEERAQADQILERTEFALEQARALFEARHALAGQLARLLAAGRGEQSPAPTERAEALVLARELGRLARAAGLAVEDSERGVKIQSGGAEFELGLDGISLRTKS